MPGHQFGNAAPSSKHGRAEAARALSRDAFKHGDEFVDAVAVATRLGEQCTALGVPATGMPRPRRNSNKPSSRRRRAQDRVGVDVEHGGEILGKRQPLAGFGFAFGDGAPDLGGDLLVQVAGVDVVDLSGRPERSRA